MHQSYVTFAHQRWKAYIGLYTYTFFNIHIVFMTFGLRLFSDYFLGSIGLFFCRVHVNACKRFLNEHLLTYLCIWSWTDSADFNSSLAQICAFYSDHSLISFWPLYEILLLYVMDWRRCLSTLGVICYPINTRTLHLNLIDKMFISQCLFWIYIYKMSEKHKIKLIMHW